ncbi:hypothetical protein [Streptomyces galbus]|uniref:Calcium-binding protein n=1 Tax=Streptomyces galbus TaxID=33898 RepID=A0A4V6AXA2_STRGB|nr:hypothetical protein [Streptomyces galbus]TKT06953.1 hypothetical protein E4U92_24080 [Streptomyces galbus]GHD35203.1 hypothetical protein GCM10010335_30100 [Streptomyces galbus]
MRIRATATVAASLGALALTALAAPAAQATGSTGPAVTFSAVKVNGGRSIVVGASAKVSAPVTYTVTKPAGLSSSSFQTGPVLYRGASITSPSDLFISDDPGTCTAASSTVLHCKATIVLDSAHGDLINDEAGAWKVGALAVDSANHATWKGDLGSAAIQRLSKLTADATPEPVRKGATITVTGKLTRANWDTNKYAGYASQPVKLQFRKKGSSTYTTVKTIKTSSTGTLKTTVKATADGYFRYTFAGTTTTPAVSATGDFIDVR